jgi:hypothetical protein
MREFGNPALPLLIGFSMFRDDFPWLYELAAQFSRAVESGSPRGIRAAHKSIMHTVEMLQHSPMGDMLGMRDDESMMMVHTLMRMVERFIPDLAVPRQPTATSKGAKGKSKATE